MAPHLLLQHPDGLVKAREIGFLGLKIPVRLRPLLDPLLLEHHVALQGRELDIDLEGELLPLERAVAGRL